MEKTKQVDNQLNIIERNISIGDDNNGNNDYEDYEAELNPYKRNRQYEFVET